MRSTVQPTPVIKKRGNPLIGCLSLTAGAFIFLIILAAIGANHSTTPEAARSSDHVESSGESDTNVAPVSKPHVVFKQSGSGIQTTERFAVSDDWDIRWAYDCSNFGNDGNFVVTIFKGNTMSDEAGVNELGSKQDGTEHLHGGAGERYLEINSECNWEVEAVSE
jgi:hypothetical protein